jgi:hypothetical protein
MLVRSSLVSGLTVTTSRTNRCSHPAVAGSSAVGSVRVGARSGMLSTGRESQSATPSFADRRIDSRDAIGSVLTTWDEARPFQSGDAHSDLMWPGPLAPIANQMPRRISSTTEAIAQRSRRGDNLGDAGRGRPVGDRVEPR